MNFVYILMYKNLVLMKFFLLSGQSTQTAQNLIIQKSAKNKHPSLNPAEHFICTFIVHITELSWRLGVTLSLSGSHTIRGHPAVSMYTDAMRRGGNFHRYRIRWAVSEGWGGKTATSGKRRDVWQPRVACCYCCCTAAVCLLCLHSGLNHGSFRIRDRRYIRSDHLQETSL